MDTGFKKNLIFDIGGVIINDSNELLSGYLGLSHDSFAELNQIVYGDARWKDEVMLGHKSQEDYAKELISEHPEWRSEIEKCLLPQYQPEVVPVIQENVRYILSLKQSGKYNLYVLSNLTSSTHHYLKDVLKMFDGGIYSFQAHVKKPDPKIYEALFTKYNLKPEDCLFFDDKRRNVETGETLGMKGIVVKSLDDIKSADLI